MGTPLFQRRGAAALLVLLSGVALFCLSLLLQVFAWELRPLLHARFGWTEAELPHVTAKFVDLFGYRPHSYLAFVVWWFWWPMVGALGYCHLRYPEPSKFGQAFLFAFVACWVLFLCFLAAVLMICTMPFVILLDEMHRPPRVAALIVPISWLIPADTVILLAAQRWRCRSHAR